ncbi:MAG: hypothetical protein ACAI35_06675 [Candidatus Methylacidiphilales bacterium]
MLSSPACGVFAISPAPELVPGFSVWLEARAKAARRHRSAMPRP